MFLCEHVSCSIRAACSSLKWAEEVGTRHMFPQFIRNNPQHGQALCDTHKGASITTHQPAQGKIPKEKKNSISETTGCFSFRHGEKTLETTLSILQIICVSQLQNKQLEKVLCSRAYRTVNGQKWAQFSPHGEISPVLTETHPCMELQPQVTSMGSLPLPTGGNVSVCSLHPSTALPPHFLWLYLLMQDGGGSQPDFWGSLVSSSPSFATSFGSLSGPAAQLMAVREHTALTKTGGQCLASALSDHLPSLEGAMALSSHSRLVEVTELKELRDRLSEPCTELGRRSSKSKRY